MNYTVSHDVAPSGAAINSCVDLLIPEDDEKFPKRPWRARTRVDSVVMMTSHHETRAEATASAEGSHASHIAVHSNYPEYQALKAG